MPRTAIVYCIAALLYSNPAAAQDAAANYPTRTVQVVLPFPPGAGTDLQTRLYSQRLSEALGKPFIVDNRPGAGGTIGSAYVAKAAPDGYTLMPLSPSTAFVDLTYPDLPYSPLKDFAFISLMTKNPSLLVVSNAFPATDIKGYMDYVRKFPGKVNFGTGGAGSSGHQAMAYLHHATKTEVTFIHFKGGSPANNAVISGQVDAGTASVAAIMPQIKAGKVRVIGVTALERIKLLPNVPTFNEQALPGFESVFWLGITAPAKTPQAIVNKLAGVLGKIARDPEIERKFADDAVQMVGSSPQEFAAYVATEHARKKKLIEDIGLKLESPM